jgi:hypothetical protein
MREYIYITDTKKIFNPSEHSDISFYEGTIENYDFNQQMDNYKNIAESLRPFNIKFNYIWSAEFTDYTNKVINHFVAKTENNEIFWQKYRSKSPGSGQNILYIFGQKIKTTCWLYYTEEQRMTYIKNNLELLNK